MLGSLKLWGKALSAGTLDAAAQVVDWVNRRVDERHDVTGRAAKLKCGNAFYQLHLKDISCSGASGLTDAPVEVGQLVQIQIAEELTAVAEVRWVRRVNIGVAFEKWLNPNAVVQFVRAGGAKRP